MADELQVFPLGRAPGRINESVAQARPNDFYHLINTCHRYGSISPRPSIDTVGQPMEDDQGSPSEVDGICAIEYHAGQLYIVSFSSATNKVYLHSLGVTGGGRTLEAVVWTNVNVQPRVSVASFEGGTSNAGTKRLYIADYDQNQPTRFWDGDQIKTVSVDLDNDDTDEDVKFRIVHAFSFHLWGVGWFEDSPRVEMIRFSQPGAIPGTDPAGGNNPKEWFAEDHRSVGSRGNEIRALASAGERMIVFKENSTHVVFGTSGDNFTRQTLSENVGAVGPYAVAEDGRGRVFFMSSEGPYVTDGQSVQYIGEGMEVEMTSAQVDEEVQVGYNAQDGRVFFVVDAFSINSFDQGYKFGMVYDVDLGAWVSTESWMDEFGNDISVQGMVTAPSTDQPGPTGDPSSLTASAVAGSTDVLLQWSNGDTNADTQTQIYRSTSTGFSLSDDTLVTKVGAGDNDYTDSGTSADTEYFYKVRHIRNGQLSSATSEASATTNFPPPQNLSTYALSTGQRIEWENPVTDTSVKVHVERCEGSSCSDFEEIATVGDGFLPDLYNDDDGSVVLGQDYTWRLRYELNNNFSNYSAEITATAGVSSETPTGPIDLSVTKDSNGNPVLDWADQSDNEDNFEVHRATSADASFSVHATTQKNKTEFTDNTYSAGTQYYYRVRATNEAGNSDETGEVSVTAGSVPDVPQNFSVDAIDNNNNEVDMSWDDVASETEYQVLRNDAIIATVAADTTTYTDTLVADNTFYDYAVRACNAAGCSAKSNEDTAALGPNL